MQPTTPLISSAVSPAELARMWKLDIRTVRRLIDAGEIGAFRIGRSVRIPAEEIDRLTRSAARP